MRTLSLWTYSWIEWFLRKKFLNYAYVPRPLLTRSSKSAVNTRARGFNKEEKTVYATGGHQPSLIKVVVYWTRPLTTKSLYQPQTKKSIPSILDIWRISISMEKLTATFHSLLVTWSNSNLQWVFNLKEAPSYESVSTAMSVKFWNLVKSQKNLPFAHLISTFFNTYVLECTSVTTIVPFAGTRQMQAV